MSTHGPAGQQQDDEAALSGVEFGAAFHHAAVGPLLAQELPGLRYAAARLGSGSDVLGLDDVMSRDHDWGCRLTLLVDGADQAALPVVRDLLARRLPDRFRGRPVRFAATWDASVSHKVEVATVGDFAASRLGVNPLPGLSALDWLVLTGQSVLEVIAGPVYADATVELAVVRRALAWYPPDIERYLLACGWHRLAQRMPFVGRTAATGQRLQSRLLSAALAGDLIDLAFLLHQQWRPYEKWREAMFARLPCATELRGPLEAAATAADWHEREAALAAAIEVLVAVQRHRGLPTPATAVTRFWDRPYRTVAAEVPDLLLATITDPLLSRLSVRAGSADQWADSADVLAHPYRRAALTAAYRAWLDAARPPGQT
jgi:Domain of unknown function (DUF4037)